jgi:all-trans-8'-apo-beta-carotenal 15,15'-oxygenase
LADGADFEKGWPMVTTATLDPVRVVTEAYRPVESETDARLPLVEGRIPDGLRGVLVRNGAGSLEVHGTRLQHPFDGDGMVSRFEIGPDGVRYRNRWVRTREFEEEARAGRILYRNFGTNIPGGFRKNAFRMRFKNAANTSVIQHAGALYALWEAGLPHRLDPDTLETLGRDDFGGQLSRAMPTLSRLFMPEAPFTAHPKRDPVTGHLHAFGLLIAPQPALLIYDFAPDGSLASTRRLKLDGASFMHDFVITEHHLVFFVTPIQFDVPRALSGLTTPVEAIRRDPDQKTKVIIVPKDGGPERRIEADTGFFIFHFFNAFEDERGRVVVDGCRMNDFPGGTIDLRDEAQVRRATFDPAYVTRWTIEGDHVVETRTSDLPMELPFIDSRLTGRRCPVGWATARTQSHDALIYCGLARVDLDSGATVRRDLSPDLPGEPVFVPRAPDAAPGDGWILSVVYRGATGRSELWILDAADLSTQARFELPHHLPPGFHGTFWS